MSAVESIVEQYKALSDEARREVMRELARLNLIKAMDRIIETGSDELPISDDELDEIVHEARGEMLRARGL